MPREMIAGGKMKAMKSAVMKVEGDFAKMEKAIVTGTPIVRACWFVAVTTALGGMETTAV